MRLNNYLKFFFYFFVFKKSVHFRSITPLADAFIFLSHSVLAFFTQISKKPLFIARGGPELVLALVNYRLFHLLKPVHVVVKNGFHLVSWGVDPIVIFADPFLSHFSVLDDIRDVHISHFFMSSQEIFKMGVAHFVGGGVNVIPAHFLEFKVSNLVGVFSEHFVGREGLFKLLPNSGFILF